MRQRVSWAMTRASDTGSFLHIILNATGRAVSFVIVVEAEGAAVAMSETNPLVVGIDVTVLARCLPEVERVPSTCLISPEGIEPSRTGRNERAWIRSFCPTVENDQYGCASMSRGVRHHRWQ